MVTDVVALVLAGLVVVGIGVTVSVTGFGAGVGTSLAQMQQINPGYWQSVDRRTAMVHSSFLDNDTPLWSAALLPDWTPAQRRDKGQPPLSPTSIQPGMVDEAFLNWIRDRNHLRKIYSPAPSAAKPAPAQAERRSYALKGKREQRQQMAPGERVILRPAKPKR